MDKKSTAKYIEDFIDKFLNPYVVEKSKHDFSKQMIKHICEMSYLCGLADGYLTKGDIDKFFELINRNLFDG